jgi:hypothetical protein
MRLAWLGLGIMSTVAGVAGCGRQPQLPAPSCCHGARCDQQEHDLMSWIRDQGHQAGIDVSSRDRSRDLSPGRLPPTRCAAEATWCQDVCDLADAVCDDAAVICDIAACWDAAPGGDPWARDQCAEAKIWCEDLADHCCDCQP